MPTAERLEHNPYCIKMLQTPVNMKEQPTMQEFVSLTRDCQAIVEAETPKKLEDPRCFNIPVSINGVYLGDALCDLGASINLMSLGTFKKIRGPKMKPTKAMICVADETMTEAEGVQENVQVQVEKFTFLAYIVVMDMEKCPLTLGRSFLATSKARINVEQREIVLRSKGRYMIYHLSKDNIRAAAGTECFKAKIKSPHYEQELKWHSTFKEKERNEEFGDNTSI